MLIGLGKTGKASEIKTNENGALMVEVTNGGAVSSEETTLSATLQILGTTSTSINVNKKVTSIDIANYSETASITVVIDQTNAVIGPNIATTLVVNKNINSISLTASEAETQAQIIVKGVN